MRFFKRILGVLGFGKDEGHETKDDDDDGNTNNTNHNNNYNSEDFRRNRMNADPIPVGARKGFSVPVQVPVERSVLGPILFPCNGDGGVQGLRWYEKRMRIDEDGDVADEFFHEVSPDISHAIQDQPNPLPRFQVKHIARPAKVKKQAMTLDGKFQQAVEIQGRLQWV